MCYKINIVIISVILKFVIIVTRSIQNMYSISRIVKKLAQSPQCRVVYGRNFSPLQEPVHRKKQFSYFDILQDAIKSSAAGSHDLSYIWKSCTNSCYTGQFPCRTLLTPNHVEGVRTLRKQNTVDKITQNISAGNNTAYWHVPFR